MRISADRRLRRQILSRLDADQVDRLALRVRVRHGRVTVAGLVPSHSERLRVRVIVTELAGDGNVEDRMAVRPLGRDWALTDEAIASGVHGALAARGLDRGIGIDVHDHVVGISGEVPDQNTRAVIRHVVQDAPGVHFVDNRVHVRGLGSEASQ